MSEIPEQFVELLKSAYIAGATDVHNNWQEDRDPDFSEAASDYAASINIPVQPTFEQRVEAMTLAIRAGIYMGSEDCAKHLLVSYDRHLAEIMAPVDPLVEAMDELEWCNTDALASHLRKALADRGLEIREVQG